VGLAVSWALFWAQVIGQLLSLLAKVVPPFKWHSDRYKPDVNWKALGLPEPGSVEDVSSGSHSARLQACLLRGYCRHPLGQRLSRFLPDKER